MRERFSRQSDREAAPSGVWTRSVVALARFGCPAVPGAPLEPGEADPPDDPEALGVAPGAASDEALAEAEGAPVDGAALEGAPVVGAAFA